MSKRRPKRKPNAEATAMAFFNMAGKYLQAATRLSDQGDLTSITDPLYFLFFHTVELALKAFLRANNLPVLGTRREKHTLTTLYEECRRMGLIVGPADRFQIGNIVSMLETGNRYQGFRYFNLEPASVPELKWTRDVVEQLMLGVKPHVEASSQPHGTPEPQKLTIIWGKPQAPSA